MKFLFYYLGVFVLGLMVGHSFPVTVYVGKKPSNFRLGKDDKDNRADHDVDLFCYEVKRNRGYELLILVEGEEAGSQFVWWDKL